MVVFQALFLASSVDCFLHGHGDATLKGVALGVSLLAVALNSQWAFVLAEVVWFAVFAKAHLEGNKPSSSPASKTTSGKREGEDGAGQGGPQVDANAPPPELKRVVDASMVQFLKNVEGTHTCDNQPWTLVTQKEGVRAYSAVYPNQKFLRWRIEVDDLYGPSNEVYDELFDFEKRCGPKGWDEAIAWGRVIRQYSDGYRVVNYSPAPAAGGLISGREFVEGRVIQRSPDGSVLAAGTGLEQSKWKSIIPEFPAPKEGLTVGLGYPGGGVRITPAPGEPQDVNVPRKHKFVLVTNADLGGWLFPSVINTATPQALVDSTIFTKQHLDRKFKRPVP